MSRNEAGRVVWRAFVLGTADFGQVLFAPEIPNLGDLVTVTQENSGKSLGSCELVPNGTYKILAELSQSAQVYGAQVPCFSIKLVSEDQNARQ